MTVNINYPVAVVVLSPISSEFHTFTNGLCHRARCYHLCCHVLRYFPSTSRINNLSVSIPYETARSTCYQV